MPDLPSYYARITPKPVGKAPIPLAAADVGAGAIGRGLQQVGRGISDIGSVLFQIKQEQLALSDAINTTKANAFIIAEEESFVDYMSKNDPGIREGAPSDWELEREKSWNELKENIAGLSLSNDAKKLMEAKLFAYGEIRDAKIRTAQSNVLKKQAEAFLQQNLQDAIQSGDEIKIADAIGTFRKNAPSVWGADKVTADAIFEEAIKDGTKEFYIDQSKLIPDDIIELMQKKKKDLGKAGKDKDSLGAKDYDDITASAYNAKALAKKSLDVQQQIELDELGDALVSGEISWTMIKNKRSLAAEHRETYRLKMNAEALRKSQGLPIIVNSLEVGRLGDMIPDISRDRRTYDEVKKEIDEARFPTKGKPLIDDAVHVSLINRARTTMVKSQADSHSRIMRDVRSELRVKDESMMMLFLATLEDKDERNLAESTNQRQAERANALEEEMYEWEKDNPKATRDDFEDFKHKNLPHFRIWEPGMPLPTERKELPIREEPQLLSEITLMDIAPFLENAKVDRLTIYTEGRKLSPIWNELSKEEKLTAYQALAQGRTAQQIIDYFNRK